jgi:tRNA threonylcarbamoyladenosine biosynthesis protein TsaE
MIFNTNSEQETSIVAQEFAATLRPRDIVLLNGDLGLGKSVFSRSVIRALMNNENIDVPSPTFTLVQTYDTPQGDVYHFDLYRLKTPEELYEIGWEDALHSGIILVEWPERLGFLKPKHYIQIDIKSGASSDSRFITIQRI